jgi:archaemetzincin
MRPWLAWALVVGLFSTSEARGESSVARILYVQPLGACADKAQGADEVSAALRAFYPIDVRALPCVELPASAYFPPRHRYRAERLLTFLNQRMPADGWRILGLTAVDISTTKDGISDWGVLGLGEMPGKASVISLFRCKKTARSQSHAVIRLAKVAVHEVGHTLGLEHCPTVGCLMEDARGKVATTDRERDFCPRCRALALRAGLTIAKNPPAAWLTEER